MLKQYAVLYIATLLVMTAMDILWLKGVAHEFYKNRLGEWLEFRAVPAILFYLMYTAGILIFASAGETENWLNVPLYGALLGFVAYATYDLTNLATLRGWPLSIVIVDIAWGTFTTAAAATAGWWITKLTVGS